ncbi:flagellar motor protein MotB [Echinimonas agarilytica]|uniref:OmpA family protein n=1 Tax=Echinimonas agarilytica TaxID=1215918 RepID=A0AA41W4Z0_9GAMM|nr:OmpA family protein [Echinimonas agarilytica]
MYKYNRARRHRNDQHIDRWLVSYADYMTLMFALFVVLYAMALAREGSLEELTQRLGDIFNSKQTSQAEPNPNSGLMLEASDDHLYGHGLMKEGGPELVDAESDILNIRKKHEGTALSNLENDLNEALQELVNAGFADIERQDDWLVLSLSSNLIFASGSSNPSSNLKELIPVVAKVLAPADNYIRVRGYTDSAPIDNEVFSSNWDLSAARAAKVLDGLIGQGIRDNLLALEAFGPNFPRATNETSEGRAANRRVEIAVSKWASPTEDDTAEVTQEEALKPLEKLDDYDSIQVIELPGGGIRITTRRSPDDPAAQEPQP